MFPYDPHLARIARAAQSLQQRARIDDTFFRMEHSEVDIDTGLSPELFYERWV
jgi:hypothetical protein